MVRALAVAAGGHAEAEEWAQDAFAAAYRRWKTVAVADRPAAWVYVVALRSGRRRLRRDEQRPAPSQVLAGDFAERVATTVDVRTALDSLTTRQKTVIVMTYFGGLATAEIASGLGIAQGTVKATLHQARGRLVSLLTTEGVSECR